MALQPGLQLSAMSVQNGHEFVIVDVTKTFSEMGIAQQIQVCHQLPQPHVGGQRPHFLQYGQSLSLKVRHGSTLPDAGR